MLPSLMYLVLRMLLRVLVPNGLGEGRQGSRDRRAPSELSVLRRQNKRPRFSGSDRAFPRRYGST
jgi:hypothetical protein